MLGLAGEPGTTGAPYRRHEGLEFTHQRRGVGDALGHAQPAPLDGNGQGPDQFLFRGVPAAASFTSSLRRSRIITVSEFFGTSTSSNTMSVPREPVIWPVIPTLFIEGDW